MQRSQISKDGVVERITYPSPEMCIYCGTVNTKLTDEHIIAANLGGTAVLERASCAACAKITGRLEQSCLRGILNDARVQLGLRQRKRGNDFEFMPARVVVDGSEVVLSLPFGEHPTMLYLPYFSEPQVMRGAAIVNPRHRMKIWHKSLNFDAAALRDRNVQSVLSPVLDTHQLGRMLAKIAHAFAVANIGVNAFKPFLPSLVLDDSNPPPFLYVGGTYEAQPAGRGVHQLAFGNASYGHRKFVAVRIQLFACLAAPAYHVVVGER